MPLKNARSIANTREHGAFPVRLRTPLSARVCVRFLEALPNRDLWLTCSNCDLATGHSESGLVFF